MRKVALADLPGRIHFGAKMIEQGVLTMVDLLRRENLVKRLDVDLDAAAYLDCWVYHQRFGGFLLAQPLGVVAHVSAGNVFVGGVDSLIEQPRLLRIAAALCTIYGCTSRSSRQVHAPCSFAGIRHPTRMGFLY